eukprot:12950673-Alexandrium_andersonii.AAC.1
MRAWKDACAMRPFGPSAANQHPRRQVPRTPRLKTEYQKTHRPGQPRGRKSDRGLRSQWG